MNTKVFMVDDHEIILMSLKDLFEEYGIEIVGMAKTTADARDHIPGSGAEVAIVDLTLPDGSGLDLIEDLKDLAPDVRIVVFSMRENVQTISDVYRSGVKAFVPKFADPTEVITAIKHVLADRHYFYEGVAEELAKFHASGDPDDPASKLTRREMEIFRLYASGDDVDQIADKLDVGYSSIMNRLNSIKKKLGLSNQAQFTILAMKYGHFQANDLIESLNERLAS